MLLSWCAEHVCASVVVALSTARRFRTICLLCFSGGSAHVHHDAIRVSAALSWHTFAACGGRGVTLLPLHKYAHTSCVAAVHVRRGSAGGRNGVRSPCRASARGQTVLENVTPETPVSFGQQQKAGIRLALQKEILGGCAPVTHRGSFGQSASVQATRIACFCEIHRYELMKLQL